MRRLALPLAALAALVSPTTLSAQESPADDATQALRCAIWASYYSVDLQGQEEALALSLALNYFVGRYEGLTGKGIDTALDEKLIVAAASSLDALTPVCLEEMGGYGQRMLDWSKALQKIGDALPENASKS